jgi:hypothetical protein
MLIVGPLPLHCALAILQLIGRREAIFALHVEAGSFASIARVGRATRTT